MSSRKEKKATKVKKQRKQKPISATLSRRVALILLIAVLVLVTAYNFAPDWLFYVIPATRMFIAMDELQDDYGTDDFYNSLKDVEKSYDSVISVYSQDGRFIYSSTYVGEDYTADNLNKEKFELPDTYENDYTVIDGAVITGGSGFLIEEYSSGHIKVDFLVYYRTMPGGERVELCMQVSQVAITTKIDFIIYFTVIVFCLVFALTAWIIYVRKFTKPITNMVEITDKMAALDFSQKCPETKIAEITSLSAGINKMSDALSTALGDLQEKNSKLLADIENERTLDQLRQTFISGISHELKTPIAIIQGYAEGAKLFYESGSPEKAAEYCDTVANEAVRMNNMIMRLLEITKYDSGAYEPNRERFEIRALVEDWFERNAEIIASKGVSVENSIPAGLYGNGDTIILASVVNNYLSNAMSHIDFEKRITVSAEDRGGFIRVNIFNTGRQIAEKDIDKIWTSFYRADKSLSRSQGRFGLGLAIVASIQKLHGAEYGVENKDGGVTFWFDVKKDDGENTVKS